MKNSKNIASIHSIETCGTVDGPGIRYVVFFQGCPLRCLYCHNPDTWKKTDGKPMSVQELVADVKKYRSYMKRSNGGFTASGGEPLIQHEFLLELFKKLRKEGIHTAIDTSGYGFADINSIKELLSFTCLVLLDIKSIDPSLFNTITSVDIDKVLTLSRYLSDNGIDMWIRSVIVPGLTDDLALLDNMAQYLTTLKTVKKIELLPYHGLGEFKWAALDLDYSLRDVKPPEPDLMEAAKAVFRQYNLPI